uniref:Uncharacterized protein n=1 Tax=Romanomermis culicivorax TaxID=13658 RepID=A0A915IE08_ROMCU
MTITYSMLYIDSTALAGVANCVFPDASQIKHLMNLSKKLQLNYQCLEMIYTKSPLIQILA